MGQVPIHIQKMGTGDDPEVYLHTFKGVATAVGWPKDHWTLIGTPCHMEILQEMVDTLMPEEAAQYETIKSDILHTLNQKLILGDSEN